MLTELFTHPPGLSELLCRVTIILCCLGLSLPSATTAEIYKYRNENGQMIFVDDKDKIPPQFQEKAHTLTESGHALGSYDSGRSGQDEDLSTIDIEPEDPPVKIRKSQYQTAVIIKNNRVLVPAEVAMGNRTVELTLLLDTGATATVFHREALRGLELPKGRTYKARVAGGTTVKSKKMKFRFLKVGPFQIDDKSAMVINLKGQDAPFDGMLGMDFLKDHPYQIDYDNQVLIWERAD